MNKDIQTLIEREAEKKYLNLDDGDFLDFSDQEKLKAFKNGASFALSLFKWRKVIDELPPLGEEVIFYNPAWVDEDFNPKGTRIGFRLDEDYVSSYYWSDQDCYMTISHSECDDNPAYSEKTKSSIEPTHWMPIPQID